MKLILYIVLLFIVPITSISAQENRSRFGVEVGITPWSIDAFSIYTDNSPVSGSIGGYYEHFFSDNISLKSSLGLHSGIYRWCMDGGGSSLMNSRKWQTMLELKVEPRFYFYDNQQTWGNLFVALPISLETGAFENTEHEKIFESPQVSALALLGYQYYITNNWFIEANAGLGWSCIKDYYQTDHELSCLLGLRAGYSF